jgi:ribosomal protein S1
MHVSETDLPRGEKLASHFREGDPIRVKILRIETHEQRIGLSSRDLPQPAPATGEADAPAAAAPSDEAPSETKTVSAGLEPAE